MFCTAANLRGEFSRLGKIHNAGVDSIRVPKLLGYVKHAVHDDIIGFLSERTPTKESRETLEIIEVGEEPREVGEKWAMKIRQTIDELHEIGAAWGTGSLGNDIIDECDDLWVTGFRNG
ncbi:uncharacterized protein DFL_004073 [Arthrobotrys flagrans]|uniref:Uncharacterized protein n=1 Tax=Arthrobotrys flagrans TaxID=97331 RepID=A0A437A3P1_ARTFL|nr:hypothetical protein DFL_004073 [Arthrobotrys flagrans]